MSTRYELPDGRKVFGKAINERPQEYFTEDILHQLEIAAGVEFKYGHPDSDVEEQEEGGVCRQGYYWCEKRGCIPLKEEC